MEHPPNINLPFFAYGLFRPDQLAFFQLRELVASVADPAQVPGELLLRDGLPIIDSAGQGCVNGALLSFHPDGAAEAYDRISRMEPDNHYRWHECTVEGEAVNILVGRFPRKGSVPSEENEWNGWDDRLQMAYLLLWSSIERYVSLRYHLGDRVMEKIGQLATEKAFADSLRKHVGEGREIYRADRPKDKEVLDPKSPGKSLRYYYQIRSNIIHRGKGVDIME